MVNDISLLIEQTRELSTKFQGIECLKSLFPSEYARLSLKLVLKDDVLRYLDDKLIELLNQEYFPCFRYDLIESFSPYQGLRCVAIESMGFNGYDYYYYGEGASWYFIYTCSYENFDYYDDNEANLLALENQVTNFPDYHPIRLLPAAVRYVWSITGNTWLDSHPSANNEFELSIESIEELKLSYEEALEMCEPLLFFDRWFTDNLAVAKLLIDKIISR